MTLPLRVRLAAISTVVFGLLLGGVSLVAYRLLARSLDDDVTERLTELTDGLHGYLRFAGDVPALEFEAEDSAQAAFVHEATRFYQIYDGETGRLLVQSAGLSPLGLRLTAGEVRRFMVEHQPFDIATDVGRLRLSNSVGSARGRPYLLQVGMPLLPMDTALQRFRDLLIWRVPMALLVAVLASWWFSGLALAPLSRVADAARAIDVTTLEQRLPVRGAGDELDAVAHAFNETLGRLEHAIGEMRQFSAALAHELRTPLTALRGEIELAMRRSDPAGQDAYASQIEEIDRLRTLIDHILTLARAESGQIPLTFERLDLAALVQRTAGDLESVAEAQEIVLTCECASDAMVLGDANWLRRLVINLLDNALKFTPARGRVTVAVSRQGNDVRLEVRDTGIGLSPEDARRVFERFFRADPSRTSTLPGAGLGLSLVQWIAARHHGQVAVDSRAGEGSTFIVRLPAATSSV